MLPGHLRFTSFVCVMVSFLLFLNDGGLAAWIFLLAAFGLSTASILMDMDDPRECEHDITDDAAVTSKQK